MILINSQLFIFLMLINLLTATFYDLILLNSTQALCLDGSPAFYYLSKDGDTDKILLQFEGGGWCGTTDKYQVLQDCLLRSTTFMGSSKYSAKEIILNGGMRSKNMNNNFHDWKKVYISYCDGAGHQGYKSQPQIYKNTKLYFRGHTNTIQTLQNLQQKIKLFSQAKQVVVAGISAGGLSVYFWTNYIKQRVQNGKVWALSDSGLFLDALNYRQNKPTYKQGFIELIKYSNNQIDIPVQECVNKYKNQKQKCFFAENLYEFIQAPLFALQPLYDTWSINQILGITCTPDRELSKCTVLQKRIIQQYHINLTKALNNIASKENNGAWAPACLNHGFGQIDYYFNENYRVPQFSQNSASNSVKNWMQGKTLKNSFIDNVYWPNNQPCSNISSILEKIKIIIIVFASLGLVGLIILIYCIIRRRIIQNFLAKQQSSKIQINSG